MAQEIEIQIEENTEPKTARRLREVVNDAFAFIRSAEANQALATVSLDELLDEQIRRDGESQPSNGNQFNPYGYDPTEPQPATEEPAERANFLGAADGNRPSRLDRITAIQNELTAVIDEIKNMDPVDVADPQEYADAAEVGLVES